MTEANATLFRQTGISDVAVTREQLSAAVRALFDIAAWNVELPLGHAAVVTRCRCDSPTEAFASVLDPSEQLLGNTVVRQCLRAFDFWPLWGHAEFVARIPVVLKTLAVKHATPTALAAVESGLPLDLKVAARLRVARF